MAPRSVEDESEEEIPSTEDYNAFSKSLSDFAAQRGYAHVAFIQLHNDKQIY